MAFSPILNVLLVRTILFAFLSKGISLSVLCIIVNARRMAALTYPNILANKAMVN